MAMINQDWTYTPECKHENGFYLDVKFWIFTKMIFICTDCCEKVEEKK